MSDKQRKINVTIEYNDDEDAKLEFIRFFVDYYLEKETYGKVDIREN